MFAAKIVRIWLHSFLQYVWMFADQTDKVLDADIKCCTGQNTTVWVVRLNCKFLQTSFTWRFCPAPWRKIIHKAGRNYISVSFHQRQHIIVSLHTISFLLFSFAELFSLFHADICLSMLRPATTTTRIGHHPSRHFVFGYRKLASPETENMFMNVKSSFGTLCKFSPIRTRRPKLRGKRKGSAQQGFCKNLFYYILLTSWKAWDTRRTQGYSWTFRGMVGQ